MSLIENNTCLKICEELVKKCIISDKNVLSYFPVTFKDHNEDIDLNISTENDDYKFVIKLFENSDDLQCEPNENMDGSTRFLIKDENILMEIIDITINGYTSTESEEVSVLHLKSILEYLAYNHSKEFEKVSTQCNHSLNGSGYKNIQNVLFDLIDIITVEGIDINLFKEGVKKLSFSGDEVLKSNKSNLYVPSKILKSKLFFKSSENQPIGCKIINVAPERYLPLVYDVLLAILYFSVENVRQYHFHELVDHYYNTLEGILRSMDLDISTSLPYEEYNMQIKTFMPYIKLDIIYHHCQELLQKVNSLKEADFKTSIRFFFNENKKYENFISTLIFEVYECILYPNLSKEDCYKIIRNKVGSGKYEFLNWKLKPSDIRSGFLGDYYKLKINVKQNIQLRTLHLFAKYLPTTNDTSLELATASFNKEKFMYDTYISNLKSLGLKDITDFLPECYLSRSNDVLIFEDVSVLNYSSFKFGEALPYEFMKIVIKQLAKLHACSLLYEDIISEKTGKLVRIGDKYKQNIQEIFYIAGAENKNNKLIMCAINTVLDHLLDEFPDIPKRLTMKEFKVKARKAFDLMFEQVKISNKYRNVLCQGDIWGNNILFKRTKDNKPIACCIVDYQLIRYCPPSHDVLFLLYLNTDKVTKTKYMTKLIEEYYVELSNILKRYNADLNKIYTQEEFLDSCRHMKCAATCTAAIYFQMICYPPEKMEKLMSDEKRATYVLTKDRTEFLEEMQHNEWYRQKIKESIEDLYELCENDFV